VYLRRPVAVLMGATIAFGGISLTASADAKTGCPKDKGNGHGNQYPPGQCKLMTSASAVRQGQSLTISGDGFTPGTTVSFLMDGVVIGTAIADPTGHVSLTFTVPMGTSVGRHSLSMSGGGRLLTGGVTVLSASTQGSVLPSGTQAGATQAGASAGSQFSGGGSSLATTGAGELTPLAGGGAALVGLGAMTMLAARRRREKSVLS